MTHQLHARPLLRVFTLLAAAMLLLIPLASKAHAHGTTINPMSRNFSCWQRWGDDFQDPAMQTEDPMCWQAWQANPNTMWNWNGLYQNGLAGQFQSAIPDGQLCSGGHAQGGMYNSLDVPGDWQTTDIASSSNFTITVDDAAQHGADYYLVFISKQGYDPTTKALGWGDVTQVEKTGKYLPGEGTPADPKLGGVTVDIPVSAPGYTGRHVVYVIWQASHMDQAFFMCSDVDFGS